MGMANMNVKKVEEVKEVKTPQEIMKDKIDGEIKSIERLILELETTIETLEELKKDIK